VTGARRVERADPAPGAERARRAQPGHFVARRAVVFAAQKRNALVAFGDALRRGARRAPRRRGRCPHGCSWETASRVSRGRAPLASLPRLRGARASRIPACCVCAGEHNLGGDRAAGGNAAQSRHSNAQRPRTRECLRRPMSHSARGNPTDLYQRLLDANGDTVEERFQISAGGRSIAEIVRTTSGDETLYFHTDRLGSAETISTSAGQSFEQRFDPFGAPDPTNATITRAGFTGHAHDDDLGLIDMKGRVYDPLASRFTTADPIMQEPHWSQGMNRYAYVFNDPINATDPSGFISMSNIVGGFVAGGYIASGLLTLGGSLTSGNAVTTNFAVVGGSSGGSSALTMPGLLQGQPGSGPTVKASPEYGFRGNELGQSIENGTDIPGNVPDSVARPDAGSAPDPSGASVVALPRALVAIAEVAEAWLARAGAALRALGPTLSAPELAVTVPVIVPSDSVQMVPAPKTLDAFPDATRARPKTPVQGGQGLRSRWRIPDGDILEWDSRHGTLERYSPKGKHKGEFDPKTGRRLKPPNAKYRVEP
jgi:RHS repeat-associated protein